MKDRCVYVSFDHNPPVFDSKGVFAAKTWTTSPRAGVSEPSGVMTRTQALNVLAIVCEYSATKSTTPWKKNHPKVARKSPVKGIAGDEACLFGSGYAYGDSSLNCDSSCHYSTDGTGIPPSSI